MNDTTPPEIDDEEEEVEGEITYSISWYGADYTVDSLVKRLNQENFYVPSFQRLYVWTKKQASRFIESLLLGLPIPSVFVAKESESNKHMIVDGQQRLKTLQAFYNNDFNDQKFKLVDISPKWVGKSIDDLDPDDRLRLDDSIIPTIVFKQDTPEDDDTSIYHVFERLNTGGTKLNPQEVRNCVDAGPLIEFLHQENLENEQWREIAGGVSKRCKDQELILRFLALYYGFEKYERPMKEFLNKFSRSNRRPSPETIDEFRRIFRGTIEYVYEALGRGAFRPDRGLNAAVFDAVMVGVARNMQADSLVEISEMKNRYRHLFENEEFVRAYSQSTADEPNVATRIEEATNAFKA